MLTFPRRFKMLLAFALSLVFVLPPVPATGRAHAETGLRPTAIGSFEAPEGWKLSLGPEYPGAQGEFVLDAEEALSGERSGKLTGDFTGGGTYVELLRLLPKYDAADLSFSVQTSDVTRVGLRLTDSTGQVHQQRIALQSTTDWQSFTITKFNGGAQYAHWGGANDGVWHPPAKQISFVLERTAIGGGKKVGSARFDDVKMSIPTPELELQQTKLGNVFAGEEPASFRVLTAGTSVSAVLYDYWGIPAAEQTAEADDDGYAELSFSGLESGYYTANLTALDADGGAIAEATTSLAVLPPFDSRGADDSPFGMATHFGQTWGLELMPLIKEAGVGSIRDESNWSAVEKPKGVYTFPSKVEAYMGEAQANDIKPFIIFAYGNSYYDNGSTPHSDDGRQGFANYSREVVRHFDQVEWAEVYNEFNIQFGDQGNGPADSRPDYYFKLLKKTYETVKAEKPGLTIVGAGTSGIPTGWLEELFRLGGLNYMDAVSVHPYRYPGNPETLAKDLADLEELIKRYNNGQPKPIWITELGWPTQQDGRGVSESVQAEYIVRSHVVSLASGVEKVYWYDFMNDGTSTTNGEHNFGIVRNAGDDLGKNVPKPAYVSYATMTRQLAGKSFVKAESICEDVYGYLFDGTGGPVRVLWSTKPMQVKIKTNSPIAITDMMGRTDTYSPLNGYVYLSLSGSPVYVQGKVSQISEGGKFVLTGKTSAPGTPVRLELTVDNTEPPRGRIQAELQVEGSVYPIDVMPHGTKKIPFEVEGRDTPQTRTVTAYVVRNGQKVARLTADVAVADPVQAKVKHVRNGDEDALRVSVSNALDDAITLTDIQWQIGGQSDTFAANVEIPGGTADSADLPVPELPAGQTYPVSLTLNFEGYSQIAYEGKLAVVAEEDLKPFARHTIEVDGSLDDLTGVPSVDLAAEGEVKMNGYGGTEDLSGQIWGAWDSENLYLTVKVHDDVFSQTSRGESIWQGDGIQFGVSPGLPGESGEWYEYGLALTPEGPEVYRWIAAPGMTIGTVDNAHLAVTRDEDAKETLYELALPWEELEPALAEDGIIGFSILVNDNDGQGRKGWIEWGAGIGTGKNSSLFKAIKLVGTE